MHSIKTWLSVLLLAQLAIASTLLGASRYFTMEPGQQSLMALKKDKVHKVTISEGDDNVTLTKQGDKWYLDPETGLPANKAKINTLLNSLADLTPRWPVATSAASHQRFEVAQEKHQKRIQLYSDDEKLAELYLGTSPEFRKIHIRKSGDDAVYSVTLNNWQMSSNENGWLDKELLALRNVQRIYGEDYQLSKKGEEWQSLPIAPLKKPADYQLDTEQAVQLAESFANMRILKKANAPEVISKKTSISVREEENHQYTYEFLSSEDKLLVKRNDIEQWFEVNRPSFEPLLAANYASLAIRPENDKAGAELSNQIENPAKDLSENNSDAEKNEGIGD